MRPGFIIAVLLLAALAIGAWADIVDDTQPTPLTFEGASAEIAASITPDDPRLSNGEPFDLYEVTLAQGDEVVVDAHSTEVDLVLIVRSPEGRRWINDDASRDTVDPHLEITVQDGGPHLIVVYGFGWYSEGAYTLSVSHTSTDSQ